MKKIMFLAVVGLVLFASCRKNRNCTCTDSYGYTYTDTYFQKTKSQAESLCNASSINGTVCTLD